MKSKHMIILIILCCLFGLSTLIAFLTHAELIDSQYDVWFESNTLFVLIFIFFISRNTILDNTFIKYGFLILILNQTYDVLTEVKVLDTVADRHDLIDTMIEDGSLQIAYLLIAFGITKLLKRLNENACIDELTGLYNRKKLSSIKMSRFDLIYLDLDGLKNVNDTQGHAVGDLLLIEFSNAISQVISRDEQAFRVGGDEFVIVTETGLGETFIEKLHHYLQGQKISFSYGIETTTRKNLEHALQKTDQAMYTMKKAQRNH